MDRTPGSVLRLARQRTDLSFEQWLIRLRNYAAKFLSLGILSTLGSTAYGLVMRGSNSQFAGTIKKPGWLLTAVDGIQFIIIFVVLMIPPKGPNTVQDGEGIGSPLVHTSPGHNADQIATTVFNHYQIVWRLLWLCWLLLYLVLGLRSVYSLFNEEVTSVRYLLDVGATFTNNCAALVILFLYFILSKPTIPKTRSGAHKQQVEWIRWVTLVLVITFAEAILLAVILKSPPGAIPLQYRDVLKGFDWISGLGSATIMALYVGRLDSKFLDSPTWLLVLLFGYTAIQPLFALLDDHPWGALLLVNAALFLKCIWFLYMAWLFETGRLLFYFVRIRGLYESVNDDWTQFSKHLRRAS